MFTAAMQVVTGFAPHVTIFLPLRDMAAVATRFCHKMKHELCENYVQDVRYLRGRMDARERRCLCRNAVFSWSQQ